MAQKSEPGHKGNLQITRLSQLTGKYFPGVIKLERSKRNSYDKLHFRRKVKDVSETSVGILITISL